MAIGRALSTLGLYDLLANLIPGMAWLIILIVLFPVDWFALNPTVTPGTFVVAIFVFGFIAGHVLQTVGSWLDGELQDRLHDGDDLFTRVMEAVENDEEKSPIGEVTDVEKSFWSFTDDQFKLPDDFPMSSKRLLLVLSYLETTPATRASRFQAIHTFHRSMWAASILAVISSLISMGLMTVRVVDNSWVAVGLILIGSAGATYVFYFRKNKFEETFLRYVFLDFYQDQKTS